MYSEAGHLGSLSDLWNRLAGTHTVATTENSLIGKIGGTIGNIAGAIENAANRVDDFAQKVAGGAASVQAQVRGSSAGTDILGKATDPKTLYIVGGLAIVGLLALSRKR